MKQYLFRNGIISFPAVFLGVTILCLLLIGCSSFLDSLFNNALPPEEGELKLPGLSGKVIVKRDSMGIPFVDATSLDDLVVAQGYVSACDRFCPDGRVPVSGAGPPV